MVGVIVDVPLSEVKRRVEEHEIGTLCIERAEEPKRVTAIDLARRHLVYEPLV